MFPEHTMLSFAFGPTMILPLLGTPLPVTSPHSQFLSPAYTAFILQVAEGINTFKNSSLNNLLTVGLFVPPKRKTSPSTLCRPRIQHKATVLSICTPPIFQHVCAYTHTHIHIHRHRL